MANIATMDRPQRWDSPFDPAMTEQDVQMLLERPEFAGIDSSRFPPSLQLAGIIQNDCRLVRFKPGEIVVREGDYGNSAFLLISGQLTIVIKPGLPSRLLGRSSIRKKGLFGAISQIWKNSKFPEARDTSRYSNLKDTSTRTTETTVQNTSLLTSRYADKLFKNTIVDPAKAKEVPPLRDEYETASLRPGAIFGEIAALGRAQRTASVFAHNEALLLEIRWQGLRDIRKYDEGWRRLIDERYRNNMLKEQLIEHPLLKNMDEQKIQEIADHTLFETYGSFEWFRTYKQSKNQSQLNTDAEPIVAREGDYSDGLLLIAAGFARVTKKVGHGTRTLTYLREKDEFGLDELYDSWKNGQEIALETTLSALGYLHVLRIPAHILQEVIFPFMEEPTKRLVDAAARPLASDSLLEWAVSERFINGTQTMLINLDKCVRCDDCVRACATGHGGNPRFIRHGKSHGGYMVANACMHCVDPVCMIGCPTGAIHRSTEGGMVIINDDSCIGCGTCANSCPYENIQLVEIKDLEGRPVLDPASHQPIMKATKCDLCQQQPSGPACVRACPHDALERMDFRKGTILKTHSER